MYVNTKNNLEVIIMNEAQVKAMHKEISEFMESKPEKMLSL